MANANSPDGFDIVGTDGKTVRVRPFMKAAGTVIAIGDPVQQLASGSVQLMAPAQTAGFIGIAQEYKSSAYVGQILVCDDPDASFEVQCSGAFTAADVFANIDLVAGTPVGQRSGAQVDYTTLATTATLPFKIMSLAAIPGNAVGAYARIVVRPNQHALKAGVAGV